MPSSTENAGPIVRLAKAYADAPDVVKAEKGAAGTMPAGAFQYCEALRQASSFGWYVYPPKDISLYFDGYDVYFHDDGRWAPVKRLNFEEPAFQDNWMNRAPNKLHGFDPPFLTELFVPGGIQIWSGYFISTAPDWSIVIRPTVNCGAREAVLAYEGLVETSTFSPFPLFGNFRIIKTDVEIFLSRDRPLFQIQPIPRAAYTMADRQLSVVSLFDDNDAAAFDWDGVAGTIRRDVDVESHRLGRYAAARRKGAAKVEEL